MIISKSHRVKKARKEVRMKFTTLGSTGWQVSVIGFGTWPLGGDSYGTVHDSDSTKAIWRALDLGVNLFDTAPIYGSGHAEEVLGRALESVRKDVFIATKCGPIEIRPGLIRLDLSAKGIEEQCHASLRRLKTDYIDLLQVHWNDPAWPVEETMRGLMRLVEAGKVRAVGVSNFALKDLQAAHASGNVVALQSRYNLLQREVEKDVLPYCKEAGIAFLAYEPLARGILAGKIDEKRRFEPNDIRSRDPDYRGEALRLRLEAVSNLKLVAKNEGITPAQAAIAWLLSRPGVTSVLVGAKSAAQVVENVAAGDMVIDSETARKIDEAVRVAVEEDISGSE